MRPFCETATTLMADVPRSMPSTQPSSRRGVIIPVPCPDNTVDRFKGHVNIPIIVREGEKQVLKGIRMKEDTFLHHFLPPDAEQVFPCMTDGIAIVTNGRVGEPYLKKWSQPNDIGVKACKFQALSDTFHQSFTFL